MNGVPTKLAVEILVSFQYCNPHTLSDKQKREHHSRRPATDDATVLLRVSPAVVWNRRLVVRHKDLRFAATNRDSLPIIGFLRSLCRVRNTGRFLKRLRAQSAHVSRPLLAEVPDQAEFATTH